MNTPTAETYLGDGVYASFDGYQVKLRAPQFEQGDQVIWFEPAVITSFLNYVEAAYGMTITMTPKGAP